MGKDAGVGGDARRIGQLVWMPFPKIFDDQEQEQEQELELLKDDYRPPLPGRLRWRNLAADAEGITGDELLEYVNNDLFKALKDLQSAANAGEYYTPRAVTRFMVERIDPSGFDRERLDGLLRPCPATEMTAYRVSTRVNTPAQDDERCIGPVG